MEKGRYGFAFKKSLEKPASEYLTSEFVKEFDNDKTKHKLEFLDYFASFFRDKSELMKFLGLTDYFDVYIYYCSEGKTKILPVYYNAPELRTIAKSRITSQLLDENDEELGNILESLYHEQYHYEIAKNPIYDIIDDNKHKLSRLQIFRAMHDYLAARKMPGINEYGEGYGYSYLVGIKMQSINEYGECHGYSYLDVRKMYELLLKAGVFTPCEASIKIYPIKSSDSESEHIEDLFQLLRAAADNDDEFARIVDEIKIYAPVEKTPNINERISEIRGTQYTIYKG